MKRTFFNCLMALGLCGCASVGDQLGDIVFMPNANSAREDGETVTLALAMSTDDPSKCTPAVQPERVNGAPIIADLLLNTISRTLKAEEGRYVATYKTKASTDRFFIEDNACENEPEKTKAMRFAGFRMSRDIELKNGTPARAMDICAIALPSFDGTTFQVIPVSYRMRYAKAKLIGFDWTSPFGVDVFNPWEIVTDPLGADGFKGVPADNDLNLTMAVSFDYLHYDKDKKLTNTQTPAGTVKQEGVTVRGQKSEGYFPAYAQFLKAFAGQAPRYALPCDDTATPERMVILRDQIDSITPIDSRRMRLGTSAMLFPMPPRAFDVKGNAVATVKVEVTETDDYGKRIKIVSEAFEKEKSSLKDTIVKTLDQ